MAAPHDSEPPTVSILAQELEDDTAMKRRWQSPEQALGKVREGKRLLNYDKDLTEVLRTLDISEPTCNRWQNQ